MKLNPDSKIFEFEHCQFVPEEYSDQAVELIADMLSQRPKVVEVHEVCDALTIRPINGAHITVKGKKKPKVLDKDSSKRIEIGQQVEINGISLRAARV